MRRPNICFLSLSLSWDGPLSCPPMGPKTLANFSAILWTPVSNILRGIKQTLTDNSDRLNIFDTHTLSFTLSLSLYLTVSLSFFLSPAICTYSSHNLWTELVPPLQSRTKESPFMGFLFLQLWGQNQRVDGPDEDIFICFGSKRLVYCTVDVLES